VSTALPSTHTLAVVEDVFSVAEYSVCAGSAIHYVFACRVVVGEEEVVSTLSVKNVHGTAPFLSVKE
jgi:hypothetical protein